MTIENEYKVEVNQLSNGGTHTRVVSSNGKIIFDRMTEGINSNNKHFFDINYLNLIPKNTVGPEILQIEIKEYCCGVTHTTKRYPNGEIYFDRMEDIEKKLPKTYRSF